MKKDITVDELRKIIKSRPDELTLSKHISLTLFDEEHPLSNICDFELKNHLFNYIRILSELD